MPLVADRVKETTTTTGTGTLTLAGATTGYQSFTAAFGNGVSVYYVIAGGADWEVGIGTTGAGTLTRDTVLASSNANALVPLAAGAKDVFCAYVAGRAVTTVDAATLTNKTIDDYTNNVGANSTHFRIKAGATLAKGDVVKAVGFTPGEQAIEVVKVASSADVALGICEQALNTGNFGTAIVIGELFSVNTNGFTVGDTLYNNGAGGYTATKPSSGLYQVLGWVVRVNASNGVIAVNVVSPLYVETASSTANTSALRNGSGQTAVKGLLVDGTSSGTVTVQGAAAAGTWALTLPTSGGTNGQVLTTDGAGVTSWAAPAAAIPTQVSISANYNLSASDIGKQVVFTGSTANQQIAFPASVGSAMTAGQSIEIANSSLLTNVNVGGAFSYDTTQPPTVNAQVHKFLRYSNGKILAVGAFTSPQGRIFRLNADGTLDTTFNQISFNDTVTNVAISSDETALYVIGNFTTATFSGTNYTRNRAAKLNASTGAVDTAWNPSLSVVPSGIAVSGTTVCIAASFSGTLVRFFNTTNATELANNWTGVSGGGVDIYEFNSVPHIVAHPTIANQFIAASNSGYTYYDSGGNPTSYNTTLFHFTNLTLPFEYSITTPVSSTQNTIMIGASNALYTAYYASTVIAMRRWTLGTQSVAATANRGVSLHSIAALAQRPTDNAVALIGSSASAGVNTVFLFNGTTLATVQEGTISTVVNTTTNAVIAQTDGKLLVSTVVRDGSTVYLARSVASFEAGATIKYPPYVSGSTAVNGFDTTTVQVLRYGATIKVQKMPDGSLLVVSKTTPFMN